MSKLITNTIRHTGASSDAITLDSSGNITIEGNLTVDGTSNVGVGGATAVGFNDNVKISLGTGNDSEFYFSGTDNYFNLKSGKTFIRTGDEIRIQNDAETETIAKFIKDGAVELYHDNSKRFETISNGARLGGNADTYLYIQAAASTGDTGLIFEDSGGNDDGFIRFDTDDLYYQFGISGNDIIRIKGSPPEIMMNTTATNGGTNDGFVVMEYNGNTKPVVKIRDTGPSGNSYSIVFVRGATNVGGIYTSASATTYETSSDYRLKENVVDISDGITRIKQLKPKKFNWISDATNTLQDGFMAHEAQAVVPEAVSGTKDQVESDGTTIKPQGIDQSKLVPLLTAALQEAITKIETLETKVATLEAA